MHWREAARPLTRTLVPTSSHPNTLNLGFMLDVVFTPLVRVTRACTPSVISFAARVAMIATVISSDDGISSNANACAESCSLCKCLETTSTWPRAPGRGGGGRFTHHVIEQYRNATMGSVFVACDTANTRERCCIAWLCRTLWDHKNTKQLTKKK